MQIFIGDRKIAQYEKCYIIAELGVNHNGSVKLAFELIDVAVAAGADAVKFQAFKAESVVSDQAPKADYQVNNTGSNSDQLQMLKELELTHSEFEQLRVYCETKNIDFICTAFDKKSLQQLNQLNVDVIKWPSGEANNLDFLRQAASLKKPIILSTGLCTLTEISTAIDTLEKENLNEIILLQCVTNYPADIKEQNLRTIPAMHQAFLKPTGFSDHTDGVIAAIAAVSLGACVLEKHFTLDKSLPGPDHKASLSPQELKQYVKSVRDIELALGDGMKRPTTSELKNKFAVRRSLKTTSDLEKGHVIEEKDLISLRPVDGISCENFNSVVGRKLAVSVSKGTPVQWEMLV